MIQDFIVIPYYFIAGSKLLKPHILLSNPCRLAEYGTHHSDEQIAYYSKIFTSIYVWIPCYDADIIHYCSPSKKKSGVFREAPVQ